MTDSFVHLRLHTEYSISDSIVRISNLIASCIDLNMPAVAITDQNNFFGVIKFYKSSIAAGIKPIIGVDVVVSDNSNYKNFFKVTLLAKNQKGYKNIIKLISRSYINRSDLGEPVVKQEWIDDLADGVIVLSGGMDGDIGKALLSEEDRIAEELLMRWLKKFSGNFYIELQRIGRRDEEYYIQSVLDLAEKYSLPVIATNSVRFLTEDDFEAHEARVCINSGYILSDNKRPRPYSNQQYLRSALEMKELFSDIPSAITNTIEVAKRCNVNIEFGKVSLPIFKTEDGSKVEDYFELKARKGLEDCLNRMFPDKQNFISKKKIYEERLRYEMDIITEIGFASYFLIVADFINWAKKEGIPVGPGRGSGAGSLVAYSLGITSVDPIAYGLLFERFLNTERISMPDFDVDFCMYGRDRVIDYVANRYGKDSVSQIITYGTMAAKAVVRDVGRVLGYPYTFVDKIAKLIPFALGMTLEKALKEEALLKERYEKEAEVRSLIDLAKKLEGIVRNVGTHAGGVVIAPSVLTDFAPFYSEEDGSGVITQYDKDDVESIGLVKFDFLGLKTLTIIDLAIKNINLKRVEVGEDLIDINEISFEDPKLFELLCSCKTSAIFQLDSRPMRDLIKRLQPDCFNDIVALVALCRPGPLQSGMADDFINRKHGWAKVVYLHPDLEPILLDTYGVVVYQEQVMQIAQVLAGYSLGAADLLRRAMGKKKPEEMAKQRVIFLEGAIANNIDKRLANSIFDIMEKFAGYGFNKSHSVVYALLSYQTLWLKSYYLAEFMSAAISIDMDNTDKVVALLNDCKELGLKIIAPDVNVSDYMFKVNEEGVIVYGLGAIKGIGFSAAKSIVENRNEYGEYKNLFDLTKRVGCRKVNRKALEALAGSGSLDKIGPNRASIFASINIAMKFSEQVARNESSGQMDFFSLDSFVEEENSDIEYHVVEPWIEEERLAKEKAILGFYLTGHPINKYSKELKRIGITDIKDINLSGHTKKSTMVAGFIVYLKLTKTRNNKRMAIVTLDDGTGNIDVTIFSELYVSKRNLLMMDQMVIIEGDISVDSFTDSYKIRANNIVNLSEARRVYAKWLLLKLSNDFVGHEVQKKLLRILEKHKGNSMIYASYLDNKVTANLKFGDDWKVKINDDLLLELKGLLGDENVIIG